MKKQNITPPVPPNAVFILAELEQNGFEGHVVGGCVRDCLLGIKPKDWDITTNALPEKIKEIFDGTDKCHTVDTGIKHGTVTVVIDHTGYEVTTYRIDGEYKDSRHPESVVFTDRINDDLARRDFTMNAIAYNEKRGFTDPYGGIEDIEKGLIRAVGVAEDRFNEDALRIMRALRFSAQLGFEIDKNTYSAIEKTVPLLKNISTERIRDEFTKLIMTDRPNFVTKVWESGIMQIFMPEAKYSSEIPEMLDKSSRSLSLRLALILSKSDMPNVTKRLKSLTFDSETSKMTDAVLNAPKTEANAYMLRRLLGKGEEYARLVIEFNALTRPQDCDHEKISDIFEQIIKNGDCCDLKHLAVSGGDLIAAGVPKGQMIGEKLEKALDAVLHDPEINTKEKLIDLIL